MTDHEISNLIQEFHVPLHVRGHCEVVANFAIELAEKLIASGEKINLELLRSAALLHDLVRVVDFKKFDPAKFPDPVTQEDIECWKELRKKYAGMHHALAGAKILEERGFPEIAKLIEKHRYLQIIEGFNSWEEKILYYADKRTKHDKIVSLKERLEDGRKRNAPETIGTLGAKELDEKVYALEQEIMRHSSISY